MAKTDNTEAIERLLQHWGSNITTYVTTAQDIEAKMLKSRNNAANAVINFRDSEYVSYKVTPEVLKLAEDGQLLKAQRVLHLASYKAQELSAKFKTRYNPKAIECINDINTISMELYTNFTTDTSVNTLISSNAAIERYYNSVSLELNKSQNQIMTYKKVIDEYSKFVEEQLYALSRLDGVLKYHNSLSTAEVMNSANKGII